MLTVTIQDRSMLAALEDLAKKTEDMSPALMKIGEDIAEIAHQSFETETSPFTGFKWAERLKDTGRKILTGETGQLNDSIYYQLIGNDSVVIGDPMVYAAIHQFGGKTRPHKILPRIKKALAFDGGVYKAVNHPGSHIPARPFMPITIDGELAPVAEKAVLQAITEYLSILGDGR